MNLTPFLEGAQTATQAGLSESERRRAVEGGLLEPVIRRGERVVVRTGQRGRPATQLKLTRKGRRAAQATK